MESGAHIPRGWRRQPLRAIGEVITGRTPSTQRDDFYGGEYNLVSPADLDGKKYLVSAHRRLTRTGFDLCRALPRDAVLVGCIGNVGKLGMVADDYTASNQQINAIICDKDYDPHFIYYRLYEDRDRLENAAVKTTVPILNKTNFESFEIDVPPLIEQRKIAAVLGLVQRAIEQQERLIALTAELKKALLHKLFTEGLRDEPQRQTEIGPVPQSWNLVVFEDFATLQRGFDLPRSAFIPGDVPVVGATTIIGYHNTYNVKGPGVTVVRSGSSAGKPLFVSTNFWAHNVVLFVKDFHGNNPKFVYYKIQSLDLTKYREGVAVPTLNRNSFRQILVALPEKEEQDEFVRILDTVEVRERILVQKRDLLLCLFRTVLHQLMTTQIRVPDINLPELEIAQ